MERPLYINSGNKSVFGVLHTPEITDERKGIVFLHPYAEEKQRVDRIFVHFARLLCSKSYFVMRFDFRNCGDSEGNFEELTIDSQLSDLRNVLDVFRRDTGVEEVSLFGIRLGADIAIQYAGIDNNIDKLILWSPIINGAEYAGTLIRNKMFSSLMDKNLKISKEQIVGIINSEGRVDIDGFYMTKHFYDYLNSLEVYADPFKCNSDAFVGITKSEKSFLNRYDSLAQKLANKGKQCDVVLTDDKIYWDQRTHYEWYFPKDLIKQTLDWINHL